MVTQPWDTNANPVGSFHNGLANIDLNSNVVDDDFNFLSITHSLIHLFTASNLHVS